MLTLKLIKKNGEAHMLVCYQQCPQSINLSSILIKFEQQRKKKPIKKDKKEKEMNNLGP